MANQSLNGKAFEFACLSALIKFIEQPIIIDKTAPAYITVEKDFNSLSSDDQKKQ